MTPSAYLTTLLGQILPESADLRVEEHVAANVTILTINVPLAARRFVIGRQGRTIEAIRNLLRAYGGLHGLTIIATLNDDNTKEGYDNESRRELHTSRYATA